MRERLLLLLPLAMAGCAGGSFGRWVAGNHPACETGRLGWAIGKPASRGVAKHMMRISRAGDLRYASPGRLLTRERRPDRLTVTLDDAGRIAAVGCG